MEAEYYFVAKDLIKTEVNSPCSGCINTEFRLTWKGYRNCYFYFVNKDVAENWIEQLVHVQEFLEKSK